jgi:hypothetical protein
MVGNQKAWKENTNQLLGIFHYGRFFFATYSISQGAQPNIVKELGFGGPYPDLSIKSETLKAGSAYFPHSPLPCTHHSHTVC